MTCLRGASAVQQVLDGNRGEKITVFTIWEPILPSDWRGPDKLAVGRLQDSRAKHYWDKEHLVARQLARDARAPQPEPECCDRKGVLWDLAAVYPAGVTWGEKMPAAVLFDGTVVDKQDNIEQVVRRLVTGSR